ncbi:protein SYS1, putative [Plasmodium malariae]|uniref:Protein SYS1, putative n=1 Tax=Plasmodium malariae TaxID=5858 RepID=A0A1C3KZP5_PLAMA|nr:protein SYS1, putative [Plasmodium malariae]
MRLANTVKQNSNNGGNNSVNSGRSSSCSTCCKSYFNGDIALFCIFFTNILNSVLISYFIKIVVKRSKKHLDYVTSYGIIHLCLSIVVSRFPVSYLWYLSFFLFVMITVLISEYLCYKDDMKEIYLNNTIL